MKLQIQLSSCTRFDISVSTTSRQNKRIKIIQKHGRTTKDITKKKWIQVKYIIRWFKSTDVMHVLGCINSIFEFWCEYLFDFHGWLEWNRLSLLRLKDPRSHIGGGRCITAQPARTRPSCPCLSISFWGDPCGPLLDYRLFC